MLHSEAWRFSDSFAIFAGVLILGGVDKRKNDGRNAATFQTVGEIETSSGQFPVKPIPWMELCGVCDFVHTHARTHTHIYIHRSALIELKFSASAKSPFEEIR